uniref:Uncharacterized protein n=1 Tax=Arundo donax TaxID=35708 RepID=A0A0A9F5K7_ARUDO
MLKPCMNSYFCLLTLCTMDTERRQEVNFFNCYEQEFEHEE